MMNLLKLFLNPIKLCNEHFTFWGGGGGAIGGVLKGAGNLVSGAAKSALQPANMLGSAVGSLGGVGKVVGPAIQLAGGASPLSVFGSSLASELLTGGGGGGGGGSSGGGSSQTPTGNFQTVYAQPNVSYGTNTYKAAGNPLDVSKYFITGDKGVYNLLPAFGDISGGNTLDPMKRSNTMYNPAKYTPYEAYQDISAALANDPTALNAFKAAYSPTAFTVPEKRGVAQGYLTADKAGYVPYDPDLRIRVFDTDTKDGVVGTKLDKMLTDMQAKGYYDPQKFERNLFDPFQKSGVPQYLYGGQQKGSRLEGGTSIANDPLMSEWFKQNASPLKSYFESNPIKYEPYSVDYGLSSNILVPESSKYLPLTAQGLAKYAAQQNNPFFIPFEGAGANAMGWNPSAQYVTGDKIPFGPSSMDAYRKAQMDEMNYRINMEAAYRNAMGNASNYMPGMLNPTQIASWNKYQDYLKTNPLTKDQYKAQQEAAKKTMQGKPKGVSAKNIVKETPTTMARGGLAGLARRGFK